ncbi:MAG: ABC transporter permease [bacterium]
MIRSGVRRAFRLALRRRDGWERDVEDEIKLHLALRAEQLAAQGRNADEAYAEALRRFGPLSESRARLIDAARHREQHMQRTELLSDLRQDVSFAVRTLGRQKGWTAVTILTLALGIGATTAVFSVVSSLILHPLPYPNADRIVHINQQPSEGNNTGISVTISAAAPVVRAWMKATRSFETLEGSQDSHQTMKTANGEQSTIATSLVFPTFPEFAGVRRPLLGRMFTKFDIENGAHVVVLGESFWRNRLGSSQRVLNQTLTISDTLYTIIGVMPATLGFGAASARPIDVWLPLDIRNDKLGMAVMARLRPGMTVGGAMKELDSIFARSQGFEFGKIPFRTMITTPAQKLRFHDSLVMLAVAVALVMLVACANVAHLLLARSATRQRELAIRAALGAGRGRLLRQLLAESLVLSFTGTVCGVFLGWLGLHALIALRPAALGALEAAQLDLTTLGIAIAVAVASGMAFAAMGAMQSARASTHDALKNGSLAASGPRGHGRLRGLLVVSEMALSAMLLVGATLLVRSVVSLQHADLGFELKGLYALTVPLSESGFDSRASRADVMKSVMSRLAAIPGIRSAAMANVAPGGRWFNIGRIEVQDEPPVAKSTSSFVDVNSVQPGYFATMGMRVKTGSTFTDTTAQSLQVIINEGFARHHWSGASPIGRRMRIAQTDSEPWLTIVGVVNDVSTSGAASESTAPVLYTPMTRVSGRPEVLIRATGNASTLAPAIAMLKQLGVSKPTPIGSMEVLMSGLIAGPRFVMLLLATFTVLALILAGVGLYGVMAYTVAQRTREFGIRVALGAPGQRIARSVIAHGTQMAVAGAAIGLAGAYWGTKLIEKELYGVTRLDPASFAVGAIVLIGTAVLACVVPTRRALSVDPMTAIRAD